MGKGDQRRGRDKEAAGVVVVGGWFLVGTARGDGSLLSLRGAEVAWRRHGFYSLALALALAPGAPP